MKMHAIAVLAAGVALLLLTGSPAPADAAEAEPTLQMELSGKRFVRVEGKWFLETPAARQRGLFESAYVARLLAEPEAHLTRIQGSKLWHLALLEYWLQRHVDPPATAA